MSRESEVRAVKSGSVEMQPVPLEIGDVLLRHPWALHRGTPNTTDVPRALATIRYARRWYADDSRETRSIPHAVWQSLTAEQQGMMRFLSKHLLRSILLQGRFRLSVFDR